MPENVFDQMRTAVRQAREVERAVDDQAAALAELLRGHLRRVPEWHLIALKRELRDFNMRTGEWMD